LQQVSKYRFIALRGWRMNSHLALGFFALYVVVVSLVRFLTGKGMQSIAESRQVWERRRGILPHFLVNVAVPLIVGIVFITRGIVGMEGSPAQRYDVVPHNHIYQHIAASLHEARQNKLDTTDLWVYAEQMDTAYLAWSNINLKP
jgi:hypothetical protein